MSKTMLFIIDKFKLNTKGRLMLSDGLSCFIHHSGPNNNKKSDFKPTYYKILQNHCNIYLIISFLS